MVHATIHGLRMELVNLNARIKRKMDTGECYDYDQRRHKAIRLVLALYTQQTRGTK